MYSLTRTSLNLLAAVGSVLLEATNFVIVDDGEQPVWYFDNNWAEFTTHEQGTVAESGSSVNYYTLAVIPHTATPPGLRQQSIQLLALR